MKLAFLILSTFFCIVHPMQADQSAWDFPEENLADTAKVAIYVGSFDPLHKGHESVIEECLKSGFSHVFLFPGFGLGEKKRSSLKVRTEMLKAFANGVSVQVFEFDIEPRMEADTETLKRVRSQVVSWMTALQQRGVTIYKVLGGDAAYNEIKELPHKRPNIVDGYVLASREKYPITAELLQKFADLNIKVVTIEPDYESLSSTWLREQIKKGCDVNQFISASTYRMIRKYRFYQAEIDKD